MRSKCTKGEAITTAFLMVAVWSAAIPALANTLFAGITHSEVLPAANSSYPIAAPSKEIPERDQREAASHGVGAVPAPGTLQNQTLEWVQIPKWMAGTWTKKGDQTVSYTDLRTGIKTPMNEWTDNEMTVTWGSQFDRQGNIWQANFTPSERDATSNGRYVRFVIVSLRPEAILTDQVVSRTHTIITESVGTQVVEVFQQESLNDYVLLPSGELENRSSNRDFTYAGQPIREGGLLSRFTRVQPFVPEAIHNGIDMLKSLNDYLTAHNMSQLVRTGP